MFRITPRSKDQSKWYQQVVSQAELADYGPVRGTIIYRPYGYALWENIQKSLDERIKKIGVKNVYFPLFIPYSFLKREKEHIQGFSPELALVTYAGGKKLDEPLVIRPTSETIMYETFAKWIQSYRDLPLKINQWANVVRWEKRTLPFIRGLEFLWQEGHTVHATKEEASKQVHQALSMYKDFVQEELAMYAVSGYKTETEKFAGAVYTTSIEILLKDGKALQAGTSHMLGQNFAKSFNLKFLDKEGGLKYPWQTSWGLSTRIIGGLILALGDDKGLRLPPRIAPIQIVVIPILTAGKEKIILEKSRQINRELKKMAFRSELDDSDKTPGYKFNFWEIKGVPLRIEVGQKEVKSSNLTVFRRDINKRLSLSLSYDSIKALLAEIQKNLFAEHKQFTLSHTVEADNYSDFKKAVKQGGFVKVFYKDDPTVEAKIKDATMATARCMPLETFGQEGRDFLNHSQPAKVTLFSRAY